MNADERRWTQMKPKEQPLMDYGGWQGSPKPDEGISAMEPPLYLRPSAFIRGSTGILV
jgi:hypothetical protein